MPEREPEGDAVIIDGSALINALPPHSSKIFDDYTRGDILPKVESYGAKYKRVDIVFDVYKKSSLKSETRLKRGQGIRGRVTGTSKPQQTGEAFYGMTATRPSSFIFLQRKYVKHRQGARSL